MLTTTKATTYYSVHETTSKIFEEMVLRVPVHQGLHAGDVLAPVRDVLDAVHALGGLVGQRGRALVGRDSLLVTRSTPISSWMSTGLASGGKRWSPNA